MIQRSDECSPEQQNMVWQEYLAHVNSYGSRKNTEWKSTFFEFSIIIEVATEKLHFFIPISLNEVRQ